MPVTGCYFVKTQAIPGHATPSDANDGLDVFGFNLATATTSGTTLTKTAAFANYTWYEGDEIYLTGGTGVTPGLYEIASRTDDDNVELTESPGNASDATSSTGPFITVNKGIDTVI